MNHFIKLPDGMIINVAKVTAVTHAHSKNTTTIFVVGDTVLRNWQEVHDPDNKIYDYFEQIAQDIRIANLPVNVELCRKCDKERSNDQDEDCPHCGEMWAPF